MAAHSSPESKRLWRRAHPELVAASKRIHHAKYRDRELAKQRAWRAANSGRILEHRRQRYAAEREQHLANARVRYATNPEHAKRRVSHNLKRRALVAGAFVEFVDALTVFRRDQGICGICRQPVDPKSKWHVDHVLPLSKGGAHSYVNVQLAHARCNVSKRDRIVLGGGR